MRQPIVVEATGMRAVFQWADDRWSHHIEQDLIEPSAVIMRSMEGPPDESCPPSPVIQELQYQVEPDGTPAAMGIGKSGRCHWSLSCRAALLMTIEEVDFRALKFHIACRAADEVQRIGSCYHVVPEVTAIESPQCVRYRSRYWQWVVAAKGMDVLTNANQTLRMDLFEAGELPLPRTIDWTYETIPIAPGFEVLLQHIHALMKPLVALD